MTEPRIRAGDADRQAVVDRLTEHYTAGRLDTSEFDERVTKAYAATYLDEFTPLFADLPEQGPTGRRPGQSRPFADARPWTPPPPGFGHAPGGPGSWAGSGQWPNRAAGRGFAPRGSWPPGRSGPPRVLRLIPLLAVIAVIVVAAVASRGFIVLPLVWVGFMVLGRGGRWGRYRGSRGGPTGS